MSDIRRPPWGSEAIDHDGLEPFRGTVRHDPACPSGVTSDPVGIANSECPPRGTQVIALTRTQVLDVYRDVAPGCAASMKGKAGMVLYGLKNCDTCRKALKALPNAEFVDVSGGPVPEPVMDRALQAFGDTVLNTRSTTWRGLTASERAQEPKDLLQAHPKLMKRPLIVDGTDLYLGWTRDTQAALLG